MEPMSGMEGAKPKWQGEAHGVIGVPLERAWELASDCCGLPKWMPMVEKCERIEGEEGKPGCVRCVTGEMFPHIDGEKSWIKEKLLVMDQANHLYQYLMQDGNIGIGGYVNTIQLFDFGDGTTLVQWLFEIDPVEGSSQEAIVDYLEFLYKSSIKRLERAARAGVAQGASAGGAGPPSANSSGFDRLGGELQLETIDFDEIMHF